MPVQSSPLGFPSFYACYLLKSIQSPKSQATYIGSTPNPARRIRQHNGEISQGAWKTKHKRPWVMQMIVHGFPSKLAALQFEWAWQHPQLSRHLRDQDGKALFTDTRRLKLLRWCINTVRIMICSHPYNTWPLHVKLFTGEAVKHWEEAGKRSPFLPPGFKYQIELEGVDGKSGSIGSGRKVPIDVTDETFTNVFLEKHATLTASGQHLLCSICNKHLDEYVSDPTSTVLCPNLSCPTVSHTLCLSEYFLFSDPNTSSALIPRGGHCLACETYTLWGDLIRGSHRRSGAAGSNDESDKDNSHVDENIVVDRSRNPNTRMLYDIAPGADNANTIWNLDGNSDSDPDTGNQSPNVSEESYPSLLLPSESVNKWNAPLYPLAIARSREMRPCADFLLEHTMSNLALTSDPQATSDVAGEPPKDIIELSD